MSVNSKTKTNILNFNLVKLSILLVFSLTFSVHQALALELTPQNVIILVNNARKANHLSQLQENSILDKAANDKANDMIKHNYFAHTSPQGVTPWYWFKLNHYDYEYAGENLAIGFHDAVAQHNAWMNSPKHKENILNSHYQEIGVAVKKGMIDGADVFVTVQLFGKSSGRKSQIINQIQPSNKNVSSNQTEKMREVAGQVAYLSQSSFKKQSLSMLNNLDKWKIENISLRLRFLVNRDFKFWQKIINEYLLVSYLIFYSVIFLGLIVQEIESWISSSLKIRNKHVN